MNKIATLILIFWTIFSNATLVASNLLNIKDDNSIITLSNQFLSFSFNKKSAILTAIIQNGVNLLGNGYGSGYLMGPGFSMRSSTFQLVRKTNELIEISFTHEAANGYYFELHYVLPVHKSGIYCFLEQYHHDGSPQAGFAQIRWGLRADSTLFDYHLVRDNMQGRMPQFSEFKKKIQDWTYQLADSSYYTKYDYSDYIEGRHVHGFAGTKSGKGIFVIQASHEYLNGGPTKQYNTVHTSPFLIMMFQCNHFLLDTRISDGKVNGEWRKLGGPFFLYINSGKNINEIWADANRQAKMELLQWPYKWMKHPDYPLKRGVVTGQLFVDGKPAANAHIILAAHGFDWQAQTLGYIFAKRADASGNFLIPNVRAGKYTLYAYTDDVTEEFLKNNIQVSKNNITQLNQLKWIPRRYGDLLWQIGKADRTTKGFKLSDHNRYYGVFNDVPANLTYIIGQSIPSQDWYYAQTKSGEWDIKFAVHHPSNDTCTLTLGIAGSAKNPRLEIKINNFEIGNFYFGNDHSIYRSAILSGYYQQKIIRFPASLLRKGENILSLVLPSVKYGGGIMYDVLKLEMKNQKYDSIQKNQF